jgi:iron complex outermembrane receptor protein
VALLGVPVTAYGQDTEAADAGQQTPGVSVASDASFDPGTSGISDIVVTAERRSSSVQRSPLTILAIDGDSLERSGVSSPTELTKFTTGVEIGEGGANTQVFIRGVGSFAYTPLESPGVAFNVDDVYVGSTTGVDGYFYDIARVEVLKGPQGTLYGRNANGGSINVITNEPMLDTLSADFNAEVGNYDLIHTSGAVNLPLGEDVAVRAAFNIVDRDGYLSDGTFDDVKQSGRLRVLWEPSSNVSLLLNGDFTHLGGDGSNAVWLPRRPGASPYEAVSEPEANAWKKSFGGLGAFTTTLQDNTYQDSNLYNVSAELGVEFGFGELTIIPAYRRSEIEFLSNDLGGVYTDTTTIDQKSLEVRLAGDTGPLAWVVGGFYYDEKRDGSVVVNNGDIPVPFFFDAVLQLNRTTYEVQTRAPAAFGQATLTVADGLRLTGGIRYTHEDLQNDGAYYNASVTPETLVFAFPGDTTFDAVTYRVGAEYDVAPTSLLYANYSTGFKAGGFTVASAPGNTFEPERLRAFEIGSKNRFLNNRLQVNGSFFHWTYTNLQDSRVNFDRTGAISFITFNSGDATLYGGTLDVVARPTEADTLSFSGEYIKSEYDRFLVNTPASLFTPGSTGCPTRSVTINGIANVQQDCSGYQVARTPEFSFNASYEHVFTFSGGSTLTFGSNLKFSTARWIGIDFIPAERDKAYAVVDADLTFMPESEAWSIGVFGRNLTETIYYTGGTATAFNTGLFAANIGAPRTYGVRASISF